MRSRHALVPAAILVGAVIGLTGCNGQAPTPAPATSAEATVADQPATTTAPAAGAAPAGANDPSSPIDVCTLFPLADASRITGAAFTKTAPRNTANRIFSCEYTGTDASAALLQISVTRGSGTTAYNTDLEVLASAGYHPDPVTGVGDKAFAMPDPQGNAGSIGASTYATYGVLYGTAYIKIKGLTYVNPDQGKQIVEEIHSRM